MLVSSSFSRYVAPWVFVVIFICISAQQLVTYYLPVYAPLAASTDLVSCQTAAIARQEGKNPYNKAAFTQVAQAHGYTKPPTGPGPHIVATYLYPPFGVHFFSTFVSADINTTARIFLVLQVLAQIFTLGLFVLTCAALGVEAGAATLATAVLALFYLHSSPSQESLRIGQINPIVGLLVLLGIYFSVRGKGLLAFMALAFAGSLKIVPFVVVWAMRWRLWPVLVGLVMVVLVLNGADVQLARWFATTNFVPDKTWVTFAYSLDSNLGLPAVSFRFLHTALPGQLLGGLLLLVTLVLAGRWQWQNRETPISIPTLAAPVLLHQSSALFMAISLASGVFWKHHLHMAVALYLLALVMAVSTQTGKKPTLASWLVGLAWLYILFVPHFSFTGSKAIIFRVMNLADAAALVGIWAYHLRQGYELLLTKPLRS